jgi:CRISPR-associated protein Cmr2
MDGDHSSGLSGGTAPGFATWKDVFHSRAVAPPEGKRWVTPAVHLFLSEALADFALRCVPEVLRRHGGVPLYVGGDDVVALVPAERVLPAAQEIRDRFRTEFVVRRSDGRIEECPSAYRPRAGERLLALPGRAGTTSAAVVFRPHGGPIVMDQARDLLDEEAKERAGRDAIAVGLPCPSGGMTQWSSKWERPDGERTVDRLVAGNGLTPEETAIASLIRPRPVDRGR